MDENNMKTSSVISSENHPSNSSPKKFHMIEEIKIFSNKKIISIILGVVISISVIIGIYLFLSGKLVRATDLEPKSVVIESVTEGTAVIKWMTATETQGVLEYGTSPTALNFFAPETERTKNHKVELTLLSPETTYYFQIRIGEKVFDNAGVPWSFTTRSKGEKVVVSPSPSISPSPASNNSVSPTPTLTPTPYEVFNLDDGSSNKSCNYTDCETIKKNLGKGCLLKDYLNCKSGVSSSTPTPTATPSATLSPTASPNET